MHTASHTASFHHVPSLSDLPTAQSPLGLFEQEGSPPNTAAFKVPSEGRRGPAGLLPSLSVCLAVCLPLQRPTAPPSHLPASRAPEMRRAPGMEARGSVQSVRAQGGGGRGGQDACNQKGYLMLVSF